MYIIKKTAFRRWPVTVTRPECDDAGNLTTVSYSFIVHWAPFTEAQLKTIFDQLDIDHPAPQPPKDAQGNVTGDAPPMDNAALLARAAALHRQLVVGWGPEVCNENGGPVPFTPGMLTEMITGDDGLFMAGAFNTALFELRHGVAPAKNLPASPATGPVPAAGEAAAPTSLATTADAPG